MKACKVVIYHCLKCGKIEKLESSIEAPACCGQKMANAAQQTVDNDDQCHCVDTKQVSAQPRRRPQKG